MKYVGCVLAIRQWGTFAVIYLSFCALSAAVNSGDSSQGTENAQCCAN